MFDVHMLGSELYIIQSNSVSAHAKSLLCSKSVEYFCYILNFVDLWKEP